MRILFRIVVAVAVAGLLLADAPALAGDKPSKKEAQRARDAWVKGYLKIEEAARAETEKNNARALQLHEEALAIFQGVKERFGNWNPSVIEFRINFCAERIRALKAAVDVAAEELAKPDLVLLVRRLRKESEESKTRTMDFETELKDVKGRLTDLELKKAELDAHDKVVSALREERDRAQTENKALQEQLSQAAAAKEAALKEKHELSEKALAAEQSAAALKAGLDERTAVLKKEHEEQTAALKAGFEERTAVLKKEHEEQTAALQEKSAALSKQLEEQTATLKKQFEGDAATLKQDLTEAQAKASALEAKIAEVEKEYQGKLAQAAESREAGTVAKDKAIAGLMQEKADLAGQVAELMAKGDARATELKDKEAELASLRRESEGLAGASKEAGRLREELKGTRSQMRKLEKAAAAAEAKEAEQKATTASLATKAEALTKQVASLQERLRSRDPNPEIARLTEKLTTADAKARELEQQAATLKAKETEQGTVMASVQQKNDDLAKQLADLKAKLDARAQEAGDKGELLASLRRDSEKLGEVTKDMTRLKEELQASQAKNAELKRLVAVAESKRVEELETKLTAVNSDLKRAKANTKELQMKLLAKEEAEARLVAESRRRKEQEQELELARQKKERESKERLRGFLKAGSDADKDKDRDKAIWNYKKVLELDPENLDALSRVGILYAEKGQDVEAGRYLGEAFKRDPDNAAILLPLGFSLVRQEKVHLAISALARAAAADPDKAETRRLLGLACSSVGWSDAAETELKRSFKLDDQNAETAYNLSILLATLDTPRTKEAKEWYEKAKSLGASPDPNLEAFFGK